MTAESAIDARRYRDAIGRFATGVTVLTWDDGEHVRGMTANAVTSVSLDPMLLLACVDRRGSAHDQLHRAQAFTVNILAEDQIAVSQAFARSGVEDMGAVPYLTGSTGAPIIVGALVYATSPSYISLLWTTIHGRIWMGIGAFMMLLGVLVMRKMISFDI